MFLQECLSAIGVVHGDVACRNMYLDQQGVLKISDFSLNSGDKSKGGSRIYVNTAGGCLPVKWLAPETLAEGRFSIASDVWAFGITLWEIVTIGNTNLLAQALYNGLVLPSFGYYHCRIHIQSITLHGWHS